MTTVFLISDTGIPAPTWITETPTVSEIPGIQTDFINGGKSFLQLSEVPSGGLIELHWDRLTDFQAIKILDFWYLVGKYETLTLPTNFFRPEWPSTRVDFFKKLSPTGNWRFTEKPKFNQENLFETSVRAVLEAILI